MKKLVESVSPRGAQSIEWPESLMDIGSPGMFIDLVTE
jgi:hypothetical protein